MSTATGVSASRSSTVVELAQPLRNIIRHRILLPATIILGGVLVICVCLRIAGVGVPYVVQLIPFAVSLVLFGLPHGAIDHLVPARLGGTRTASRSIALVVVVYLLLGGATAALWWQWPLAAFAFFILLTWFHWGQGDLWVIRAVGGRVLSRRCAAAAVMVRGGIPMLVPLIAQPDAFRSVLQSTAGVVRNVTSDEVAPVFTAEVRAVVGVALVVMIAVALGMSLRSAGSGSLPRGAVLREAAATLFLVAYFAVVPAVLAIGLYFCFWHALRHIIRLELLDPASVADLEGGRVGRPFARFARDAWPITAIALLLLTGLGWISGTRGEEAPLGVYLVLISVLTVPHVVIVSWMDNRQHLWRNHLTQPSTATPRATADRTADQPKSSSGIRSDPSSPR
ncbi:beta-carotene 15,15'-monooxygenase [Curtobacterium sp. MCSS17_006]|uniref:Brp/Blh family beta-carotene 15,15'-dioxygenase n=1 Tax=unclassified Curtobacterium TaxID=257496 RepID=UPI000DAA9894|nr:MULTISPECIES: Brp/Blh family beta-carotene 15,15'-dioxygenase [unclassified Curtobacterium]PZE32883.1 beta-carotene 15,15'-monooxygenase [Curtobacterium sp. MCSS17_006]WIB33256.1 Brp/Blh family beta-carotene 15,15'-dioxygenase [Curtobacterium sp. MCSS17_005]